LDRASDIFFEGERDDCDGDGDGDTYEGKVLQSLLDAGCDINATDGVSQS